MTRDRRDLDVCAASLGKPDRCRSTKITGLKIFNVSGGSYLTKQLVHVFSGKWFPIALSNEEQAVPVLLGMVKNAPQILMTGDID